MFKQDFISISEMESIRAYLEGELSQAEHAAFAARLQSDAGLRQLVREQRQLLHLYRSLPSKKLPRNFTLTTLEAREIKRKGRLLPIFGYGSLVSAVMLVTLYFSQLFMAGTGPVAVPMAAQEYMPAPAAAPALEAPMEAMSAPVEKTAQDEVGLEVEPIYVINWKGVAGLGSSPHVGGMGGGGGNASARLGGAAIASPAAAIPASASLLLPSSNILGERPPLPAEDLDAIFSGDAEVEVGSRMAAPEEGMESTLETVPMNTPDDQHGDTMPAAPEALEMAAPVEPTLPAELAPTITPIPLPMATPEALPMQQGTSAFSGDLPSQPVIYGLRPDEGGMVIDRYPVFEAPEAAVSMVLPTEAPAVAETQTELAAVEQLQRQTNWQPYALAGLGLLAVVLGALWLYLRRH